MRKNLGLLFVLGAVAGIVLAVLMKPQGSIGRALNDNWVIYPMATLACLILASFFLTTVRRAFGVVFLAGAALCFLFTYGNGGPFWGSDFDMSRSIRQGGVFTALGGAVCAFIGLMLALGRKKPALIPGAPVEPPASARATSRPPAHT